MGPEEDKDINNEIFNAKMAVKITKGQICDGSMSKNLCHKEYNMYG